MRPLTDKQRRWLWFVILWCGGAAAASLLAYTTRMVIRIL